MPAETVTDLYRRLCQRAGVDPDAKPVGGQYYDEFQMIMRALVQIGNAKVDQYGDFRLQDIRNWSRETWGAYWDIQRKFGRLENQLQVEFPFLDDIEETLADQAVYCVRMIQILHRLREKGLVPVASIGNRSK